MKKTLKLLGLVALAAIAFSCTKDADSNNSGKPETPAGETEQPQTPGGQDSSDYLLSFGADIVSPFDTKATIDLVNKTVSFDDGDMVLVVNGTDAKTYVYEGAEFKAESDAVSLEGTIHAYYPASAYNVDTEGNVTFTMPEYLGSLADIGDKAPMAGVIAKEGNDYKASFKNVASILEVSITGDRKLNTLQLTNTGKPISKEASFTVSWNEGDPALSTEAADHATSILEVNEVLSSEAKTYYFILPAGNYEGVQIRANMEGEDANGISSYVLNRGDWDGVLRNKIYKVSFRAGLFSGGSGKPEDPYLIANVRDFKNIHNYTTNGYDGGSKLDAAHFLSACYKQTAGISFGTTEKKGDLSKYMIASYSAAFTGTYDGNGKTLSNFTITHTPENGDRDGAALFQNVIGAVLKNISITGAEVTGGKFTAGLVGYAKACTITGCSIENSTISSGVNYGGGGLIGGLYAEAADSETSTVTSCSAKDMIFTNTGSGQHFGGLIGYINGVVTVEGCSITGTSTVNGTPNYFGGIVGQTNSDDVKITGCENHSTISGAGDYAGGIVGQNSKGSIQGCTNDGSVSGAQNVGGIVGIIAAGKILGCTNTDKGTITSTGNAGGIAGQVTGGTIQTCKNSGNVNASGNNTGGIAGSQSGGSEILECWSKAQITGQYQTGGIVGYLNDYGAVVRCTAKGDVSGTQCVGGIVGHAYASNNEKARGILVMECLSKANVTASTGTNSNSGGVIGRLHSNRVSGGSIQWANVFQCVGWSATIKNTNTDACTRFGAFVGFLNTEYGSAASTQTRCQVRNSYTTVATDHMIWLAGTPSSTGGFVGQLQRGRFHGCYYQLDSNTQSATASNNLVVLEKFTKVDSDFATYLMSNLETTADNNYTGNGKSYAASAWTRTGYNGESLEYPLPSALVALGTEYYD